MYQISSLILIILLSSICTLLCIDMTLPEASSDSTQQVFNINNAITDSTSIVKSYSPSLLAGYHDGWKKRDTNVEYIIGTLLLGTYIPVIGPHILYISVKGATPDSIPEGLDSNQYIRGFKAASVSKRKASVGVPGLFMNYMWSCEICMIVLLIAALNHTN